MKIKHFYSLLLINIFLIFIPHLINYPVMLDRDIIIDPLEQIYSLNQYIDAHKNGKVLDIQPLRDISYFIDLSLNHLFSVKFFLVLQNIIILFFTAVCIYSFFIKQFSTHTTFLIVFIFINHPNTFHIYVEPTARKHILSFLFFLITYNLVIHKNFLCSTKKRISSYLLFLASILACPISLNLSLFFLTEKKFRTKKNIKYLAPFFGISLFLGLLNIYYYKFTFKEIFGFERTNEFLSISDLIMAIGLMFRQVFMPFIFSTYYIKNSIASLLAVLIAPIIIWIAVKNKNIKGRYKFIFLILIIFFTLYGLGTSVYYLNTYSLFIMFGFFAFFAHIIDSKRKTAGVILVIFSLTSIYFSYTRESTKYELYKRMVKQEPNCRLIQYLVLYAAKAGIAKDINNYGQRWLDYECRVTSSSSVHFIPFILTFLVFHNRELSFDEKVDLFKKRLNSKNDLILLKSSLYYKKGENEKIDPLYLNFDYNLKPTIFLASYSHIRTDIIKMCSDHSFQFCERFMKYLTKIEPIEKVFYWSPPQAESK